MMKLGPLDSKDSWNLVRRVSDELMTHVLILLETCDWVLLSNGCALVPLLLLFANILNLLTCQSLTLINLDSLTLFMNYVHQSIVAVVTMDNSLDLHLSNLTPVSHRMPLMHILS